MGCTRMAILPSSSTVGVNSSRTPNFLYSMVMVAAPPTPLWGTGMGNSPPARKVASWPLVVTRLGSASTRPRFCCFKRSKNTVHRAPAAVQPPMAVRLGLSPWVKAVVEEEPEPVKLRTRSVTQARPLIWLTPKLPWGARALKLTPMRSAIDAVDLRHPHFQHHLLHAAHVHEVHHLILLAAGIGQGQGQGGALGHRPRDLPGQDDGVPRGLHPDLFLGQDLVELLLQQGQVGLHRDGGGGEAGFAPHAEVGRRPGPGR